MQREPATLMVAMATAIKPTIRQGFLDDPLVNMPYLSRPGDCNADGRFNFSDPICLLRSLFLGEVSSPCDSSDANLALRDGNGDGLVDLADAIHGLSSIFLGGSAHALGSECVEMPACGGTCSDG